MYKVINLNYIKMRGLNIKNQSKKNKKELSQQEQNILDATQMKNMRPVFKNSSSGRDTPLAPTPSTVSMRDEMAKSQVMGGALKLVQEKKNKDKANKYSEGVVVSKKDEKNNPKDFKYLKNN